MNHPAYTTGTLCRTLSADHNTMINALNSLYSFIPPSLSIKLTSRSLSKLKFSSQSERTYLAELLPTFTFFRYLEKK